jgi:hypothetical protein
MITQAAKRKSWDLLTLAHTRTTLIRKLMVFIPRAAILASLLWGLLMYDLRWCVCVCVRARSFGPCPLWWEDRSAVYNCCWASTEQLVLGQSPVGLTSIFYVSDLRFLQPEGPGPHIYTPHKQGSPVILPGNEFPFYRLLWLTRLQLRYSTRFHNHWL